MKLKVKNNIDFKEDWGDGPFDGCSPLENADEILFSNNNGFNSLTIETRDDIESLLNSRWGIEDPHYYLVGISENGVVLTDGSDVGFHNFFIPYSNIVGMYQHIST